MAEEQDFARDDAADELLKAAFASYKTEATDVFARTGSPELFGEAKKHARRRAVTLGAAITGCFTLLLGGVAVATNASYFPGPSANQHGDTMDEEKAPDGGDNPDGLQASESVAPSQAPALDLRNTELTLPAWPGSLGASCPAGVFRFADGVALPPVAGSPGPGTSADPSSGTATPPPVASSWRVLPGGAGAVKANVDGKPGEEILLPVGCGDAPVHGLVALHDHKNPVGFVFAAGEKDTLAAVSVNDGVIVITTKSASGEAVHNFRLTDGQFAEVPAPGGSPSGSPSASPSPSSPPPSPPPAGGETGTDNNTESGQNGAEAGA